jgi:hypothetical protein
MKKLLPLDWQYKVTEKYYGTEISRSSKDQLKLTTF